MDEEGLDRIDDAADRIEQALARVEKAIRDKWSTPQMLAVILVGFGFWSLLADIWHAKWRYAATYGVTSSDVYIQNQLHDCAFFAAPLGAKYCHYERTISITRWSTSTDGNPIISFDDGKTWTSFDPAGEKVPRYSTVKAVYIGWEKKED